MLYTASPIHMSFSVFDVTKYNASSDLVSVHSIHKTCDITVWSTFSVRATCL